MTSVKRRIIAGFLSVLAPGLGQLFVGQFTKGLAISILSFCVLLLLCFSPLPRSFGGFAFLALSYLLLMLYSVLQSMRRSAHRAIIDRRQPAPWPYFILVFALSRLLSFVPSEWRYLRTCSMGSHSMEPSIFGGDYIVVDNLYFRSNRIRNNELAVFRYSDDMNDLSLARCIAQHGDTIAFCDRVPFVNGKRVHLPGQLWDTTYPIIPADSSTHYLVLAPRGNPDNFGPIVIPVDSYVMVGDNVGNSADSRYRGAIRSSDIVGKPLYVAWSFDLNRFGYSLE